MAQVNRVVLKRVYIGRAALFGLYYGILFGLILAIFSYISTYIALDTLAAVNNNLAPPAAGGSGAFAIALITFIASVVITPISFIILALFYNLFAKIGGALHFDLGEYEAPVQQVSSI